MKIDLFSYHSKNEWCPSYNMFSLVLKSVLSNEQVSECNKFLLENTDYFYHISRMIGYQAESMKDVEGAYNILDWDHLDFSFTLKEQLHNTLKEFSNYFYGSCFFVKHGNNFDMFKEICEGPSDHCFFNGVLNIGKTKQIVFTDPLNSSKQIDVNVGSGDLILWPSFIPCFITRSRNTPSDGDEYFIFCKTFLSDEPLENFLRLGLDTTP